MPDMSRPAAARSAPAEEIAYLDAAAATPAGAAYKQRLATALDLRAGHLVADLGCGPGTDLAGLAEAVGRTGTVLGVDHDPRMAGDPGRVIAEAGRVLRPGGPLGLAEPDWDTLAVADEDVATSPGLRPSPRRPGAQRLDRA